MWNKRGHSYLSLDGDSTDDEYHTKLKIVSGFCGCFFAWFLADYRPLRRECIFSAIPYVLCTLNFLIFYQYVCCQVPYKLNWPTNFSFLTFFVKQSLLWRFAVVKSTISGLISSKDTSVQQFVIWVIFLIYYEKNSQISKSGKLYKAKMMHLNLSSVFKIIFPPIELASKKPAVLGPWLKMNSRKERFFGKLSKQANILLSRNYRKPFVVTEQIWFPYIIN